MLDVGAGVQQVALQCGAGRFADPAPVLAALGGALAVLGWHLGQRLDVEGQCDAVALLARHFFAAQDFPEAVVGVGEMLFRIGVVGGVVFAANGDHLVDADCLRHVADYRSAA